MSGCFVGWSPVRSQHGLINVEPRQRGADIQTSRDIFKARVIALDRGAADFFTCKKKTCQLGTFSNTDLMSEGMASEMCMRESYFYNCEFSRQPGPKTHFSKQPDRKILVWAIHTWSDSTVFETPGKVGGIYGVFLTITKHPLIKALCEKYRQTCPATGIS